MNKKFISIEIKFHSYEDFDSFILCHSVLPYAWVE